MISRLFPESLVTLGFAFKETSHPVDLSQCHIEVFETNQTLCNTSYSDRAIFSVHGYLREKGWEVLAEAMKVRIRSEQIRRG